MVEEYYSIAQVADILGVSKETLRRWDNNGKLIPERHHNNNYRVYHRSQIEGFEQGQIFFNDNWNKENKIVPKKKYKLIELFAGAGGLALGFEKSGFDSVLLNEIDKHACNTLKKNRPNWNVIQSDICNIDFTKYRNEVDIISGGFPCQAFSYAGKKLGFEDVRGTLFFEFARAVKEVNPKVIVAENVRGLLKHDNGKTLASISNIIDEIGYKLVNPRVLKAIFYRVPQKRERLFFIAIRKDIASKVNFKWPSPYPKIMTMRDALKKGALFDKDVPDSLGQKYPLVKEKILSQVPQGGYWKDLPDHLQREYMKKSYFLGGGKTGMARRLSWSEPSLTLTCAPAQKQTERCHPEETRPLTIREYARIQTFPDDWMFTGPITAQYKQIGNAVPVNLAHAIGRSLIALLNDIEDI
ncbi:DNA (cytosine-5-)-methyltransferase [Francisella uliginis]|uniref:Cytosine-specific methyltransferase n=1 Tax=Francisella uliginis TaxID=573570 RepID=A0A1L4BRD5_9GAMM|nr:DNA (cytosine-5-)-methyltransferase [Francisella uliginis]API86400.1 DNA (cytosine-5-)-methyltransferase [Francisella uliginis]